MSTGRLTTKDSPHARDADDVLASSDTTPEGLTSDEAGRRLAQIGPNRLPEAPKPSALRRFFAHFNDVLIYVLLVAAVVTFVLGHLIDTVVILAVVLLNAVIGFVQEGKAEAALEGIRAMLSPSAHVRRDSAWVEKPADELVPGDIIRLRGGDRVPADARLLESASLRVEEAALTGESVPSDKSPDPVAADAGVGDRTSMVFSGTLVTGGSGIAVVTGTGAKTEIGRINAMLGEVEQLATPLTRQMDQFGKVLSAVVIVVALVLIGVGRLLHGEALDDLFLAAIGFAVAAIPEGLPAVLTIILARGVQLMARRNAITRKLGAVETLGSVTVICSDKTGTLTTNEMTVREAVTTQGRYDVAGTGYEPAGKVTHDSAALDADSLEQHPALRQAVLVAALANDAIVSERDEGWVLTGEPTEGALRTFGLKLGISGEDGERIAEVPFDSAHKYMATLDRVAGDLGHDAQNGPVILLKGAPDRLLDRSDRQSAPTAGDPGATEPLDRGHWEAEIDRLGGDGLRVLAAAIKPGEGLTALDADDIEAGGFTFLGLFGIVDPPRPEAIEAIATCRSAGITVKMITGDHAGTAAAIAGEMGIGDGRRTVTGAELEAASDEELRALAAEADVFARTSPEHKLRLVKALQADQQVVAMTGDGVNDAPALKRADVGVAMGIKGTEATKEAAEIVLADDNFTTIERAVERGRTIYDNLRKTIVFTLPTNGGESLVILAAVLAGLTLPLTPLQILWVNMVTAVSLGLALAFEPAEPGIMDRPPREPGRPILDGTTLRRVLFISLLIGGVTLAVFLWGKNSLGDVDLARTIAVNALVVAQAFYLFSCRRLHGSSWSPAMLRTNPVAWLAVAAVILLQLVFVYAPFMHTWFHSAPMSPGQWLVPVAVGLVVFVAAEAEKAWARR